MGKPRKDFNMQMIFFNKTFEQICVGCDRMISKSLRNEIAKQLVSVANRSLESYIYDEIKETRFPK